MFVEIVFWVLSTIMVVSAAAVVSSRNPVHSVLFLILTFFNAAGLFLVAGAEFLAMILVIVYVGAVAVLFLFVVMMLDIDFVQLREGFQRYAPIGSVVGVVLLAEIGLTASGWIGGVGVTHAATAGAVARVSNTGALGRVLYTDDVFLFQTAGIILLVAMIGAIVLTHSDRHRSRRQDVGQQHARSTDSVRMLDLAVGGSTEDNGGVRRPTRVVERS